MDIFFIGHRDPIFGIIVLFAIIFMVAFLSYAWGLFRIKDEKRRIEKFIKKFDNINALSKEHTELLKNLDLDTPTLGILGTTFIKSGDFEKAISVFLIALSKAKNKYEKEFILTELGSTYFKAGFLQKSSEIFLKVAELSPRNTTALKFLTMINEKLKRFDEALNTLNALEEIGSDVKSEKAYILANIVLNNNSLDIKEKTDQILELSRDFELLKRMCIQLWTKNTISLENFPDFPPLKSVIDIIYHQNKAVNLKDNEYKGLFYAKALTDEKCDINSFELNVIKNLKESGFNKAEISFRYVCNNCKNTFPMHFYRCPMCFSLGSGQITTQITEKTDENHMPF